MINAKSGSNFDNVEIDVVTSVDEGMVVSVEQGDNIPGLGDTIIIKVFGAQQNVEIEIISDEGEIIGSLEGIITSAGSIDQLWAIPAETEPGTYTIKVTNPSDSAETTYELQ
jgi:flagellar hook assembly protein FlgD